MIELRTTASVHVKARTATGRLAVFHPGGEDDGHYSAYGKKHTWHLAAKPLLCVVRYGNNGVTGKATTLSAFAKEVPNFEFYGVVLNKYGHITRIDQLFHP